MSGQEHSPADFSPATVKYQTVNLCRDALMDGLEKLQRQLKSASEALKNLDGEIASVQFVPNDPASVEAAIADMRLAVDSRVARYSDNPLIGPIANQMKEKYENHILEQVMNAKGADAQSKESSQTLFRQIENTVTDLRRAEYNSFERHIGKLSRLLHAPALEAVSNELTAGVDLDAWIKQGEATQGSMIGSARLTWPSDQKQELGLVIKLIDSFAETPDEANNFAFTFYHVTNDFTRNLQNMAAQMIVPFARDYIDFAKEKTGVQETTMLPERTGPAARKAFVVHGHDEGARESVARFLERIGFEAIILHEQANQGRTVIEKIEAHGEVGFAVVLLTPDDEGSVKGGTPQPRARQNVLLELGYFIGRLGRSRVLALKRGDVEIPSDFGGVVYEAYDSSNGWKMALGRELNAAGFEIDWNRIHGNQ